MTLGYLTILFIVSYLIGSLPPAVWISKYLYGKDIRGFGSGNAGSTNMYRIFGWKAGLITQSLDISKGFLAACLPIIFQAKLNLEPKSQMLIYAQIACGVCAVIGHVYTVFAGFKGGKGVNAILGMMLAAQPYATLIGILVFAITLFFGRMVSLASMLAVASYPIYQLVNAYTYKNPIDNILFTLSILLSAWIIFTHRSNIKRIFAGTESKVGVKS